MTQTTTSPPTTVATTTVAAAAPVTAPTAPVGTTPTVFRAGAPATTTLPALGPLQELPGTWQGSGFNLISRPDHQNGQPFFLQLNATHETLTFNKISAPIPNRGSVQDDIFFLGLHYLQVVSDATTNGALHIEPGIWLAVPPTDDPDQGNTIVRLATVPHGDALMAQSVFVTTVPGNPLIKEVSSTPLTHATGAPIIDPAYLAPFRTTAVPAGIDASAVANPNQVLVDAIGGQDIEQTVVISISTAPDGGIENIPFVVDNANATSMEAIFWIETVRHPEGGTFLQLQYTQTVMLNFLGIDWPHISVATLIKQ